MTRKPRIDYPMGTTYQPNERQLHLSLEELEQLDRELQSQWKNGFNRRHKTYYQAFIVDPNSSELPSLPSNERRWNHRFILMPLDRFDYVWISYQPVFNTSVDFQLIFLATIDDLFFSSMNTTQTNHYWTIESYEISLNDLINADLSSFHTKLYLGNSKKYLYDMTINPLQPFLTIQPLNSSEIEPYHPLRYLSYLSSNRTKSQIQFYLVHQIRVLPDFDALVHVMINPRNCTSDLERTRLNDLLEQNGNEWAFHGLENHVSHRLTSASGRIRAQLLGDIYSTICTMQIIEEIQCRLISDYSNESSDENFHYPSSACDMINPEEDKLFHGFLPIWALTLFGIALLFAVVFFAGLICHFSGCRKPRDDYQTDQLRSSMISRPLLIEKSTSIKLEHLANKPSSQSF